MKTSRPFYLTAGVALLALLLVITALTTGRRLTWLMEVMPVLIVAPVLWLTAKRYPLTPLLYALIFMGCVSLIVGGMYSYARVRPDLRCRSGLGLRATLMTASGIFCRGSLSRWRRGKCWRAAVTGSGRRCWRVWSAA